MAKFRFITFFLLVLGGIVFGCNKKDSKPTLKHDLKTLAKVIADMEFAEQLIAKKKSKREDTLRIKYLEEIEEIYNIKILDIQMDIVEIQKSDDLYRQLMDSTIVILNKKN